MPTSFKKQLFLLVMLSLNMQLIAADISEILLQERPDQRKTVTSVGFPKDCELTLGYLALSEGTAKISNLIELLSTSNWSHVAVVFCNPAEILSPDCSTENLEQQFRKIDKKNWYCLDIQPEYPCVSLISWEDFRKQKETTASFALRPLIYNTKCPDNQTLESLVKKYEQMPYKKSQLELIYSIFGLNSTQDLESTFCSELTALALKDLGLLDDESKLANNYLPADFSSQSNTPLKLEKATLGKEFAVPSEDENQPNIQKSNRGILRNTFGKFIKALRFIRSFL